MPVYMLTESDDRSAVKIGWTISPISLRMRTLQTGNRRPVEVLRVIECGRAAEWWFHEKYKALRIHGEWFSFDPEMLTILPPKPSQDCEYVPGITEIAPASIGRADEDEWGKPPAGCCWHPSWPHLSPHQWPGWSQRPTLKSEADTSWKRYLTSDRGFMPAGSVGA